MLACREGGLCFLAYLSWLGQAAIADPLEREVQFGEELAAVEPDMRA